MNVLVVGGTGFLGGAVVEEAVRAGHRVAILTRGTTDRSVVDGVERLIGDRHAGELRALHGRSFDLVLDTCTYTPDHVRHLLEALGNGLGHYVLVSSISAYDDFAEPDLDEAHRATAASAEQRATAAEVPADRATSGKAYGDAYGPLKRAAELAAQEALGDRALVLRVGLLVGAGDPSDRFTFWVRRLDQGGRIPVPAPAERPVQVIDVRDCAAYAVSAGLRGIGGIRNVTGPTRQLGAVLEVLQRHAAAPSTLTWLPAGAFEAAGVGYWGELPLVVPPEPALQHLMSVSTACAEAEGLSCRPLDDTVQQILAWDRTRRELALRAGFSAEQERALLSSG